MVGEPAIDERPDEVQRHRGALVAAKDEIGLGNPLGIGKARAIDQVAAKTRQRLAITRFGIGRTRLRVLTRKASDASHSLLVSVDEHVKHLEFKVFAGPAQDPKGRVAALRLPQGTKLTRKEIDAYTKFVGI